MKAIILFKTDFHHSYDSREIIGVFTNKAKLLAETKRIIRDDLKEDPQDRVGSELTEYINWNHQFLFEKNQTQGLSSFELVIEDFELNKADDKVLYSFL